MLNPIIHPTDFSACSRKALEYAIYLCQSFNTELVLIHSIDHDKVLRDQSSGRSLMEESKKVKEDARQKLHDLGKEIAQNHSINCRAQLYQGKLLQWFKQKANELEPRMVVMGTTGAGSLNNQIFGSNTYAMIQDAAVAILSVPLSATFKEINQLSLAANLTTLNSAALTYMLHFSQDLKAELELLFVNGSDETIVAEDVYANLGAGLQEAVFKIKEIKSDNYLEAIQSELEKDTSAIFGIINSEKSALEKLLFGSLSKNLIHRAKQPLLCLPNR